MKKILGIIIAILLVLGIKNYYFDRATKVFEKDGLSFQYPSDLKVTEQDGEDFRGFFNHDGFPDEESYGQIVVSTLNQTEKIDKCIASLKSMISSGFSRNIETGEWNTEEEQAIENQKLLKEKTSEWAKFFEQIRDGSIASSKENNYLESYNCGFAGSNFFIQPIQIGNKNAVVIYKKISQVSSSPCTYNTQVLIPKDEDNFHQIGFTYNFGNFKNDCTDFEKYPSGHQFTDDTTASEMELILTTIKSGAYPSSEKFENLFKNMRIVDEIISTIELRQGGHRIVLYYLD